MVTLFRSAFGDIVAILAQDRNGVKPTRTLARAVVSMAAHGTLMCKYTVTKDIADWLRFVLDLS